MRLQGLRCNPLAFVIDKNRVMRVQSLPAQEESLAIPRLVLPRFLAANLKCIESCQAHGDDFVIRQSNSAEIEDHRLLPTLERLEPKFFAKIVKICFLRQRSENLGEALSFGDALVHVFGKHVVVQCDPVIRAPGQRLERLPDVIQHQKGKVGRTPICWQPETKIDCAVGGNLRTFNKAHIRDRLVQFRIVDVFEAPPEFPLAVF
ncbi:hypothetical protein AJ87_41755 [Rhizobium yanglingense]|nr:hypothetical protein AJ87_41755 [Rhizobium yanglingense]